MIKISVLNDNRTDGRFYCEHGFSLLIEDDKSGKKILFDTGASDIFLKNGKLLGLDIKECDCVVLSHGHWDHANGLEHIKGKRLICHPGCFINRYRKKDKSFIGIKMSYDEILKNFNLELHKEPYKITKDIIFLGEIPRLNDFESKNTPFCLEDGCDDFVYDDSAITITSDSGLFVISGCAHSGICNTVEYAKKVTGIDKVNAVLGGFHLKTVDEVTLKTLNYFKKNQIERVYPCHCVEDPVIAFFLENFKNESITSGSSLLI